MADFTDARQSIDNNIHTNGQQEITGAILNSVLNDMVDAADDQVSQLSREEVIEMTSGIYWGLAGATVGGAFTGNPQTNANYRCAKVTCKEGDIFRLNLTSRGPGRIGFCNANNTLLSKDMTFVVWTDYILVVPANAKYMYINDNSGRDSYRIGRVEKLEQTTANLETSVDELESSVAELDDAVSSFVVPEDCSFFNANLYNPDDENVVSGAYLSNRNGATSSNANYLITGYIPISEKRNKLIASVNGNPAVGGGFWCLYDENKTAIGVGQQMYDTAGVVTWSARAAFARLSIKGPSMGNIKVEYGESISDYVEYGNAKLKRSVLPTTNENHHIAGTLAEMANGNSIVLTSNRVKANKYLSFSADIVTMGSLLIGHGKSSYGGSWLEINNTNIICHNYLTSDSVTTKAHGLTFANNLQIVIEQGVEESCTVRLVSNGNSYTTTFLWRGTVGDIYVESTGAVLANATLSWTADGLKEDIWGFGDSYFSLNNNQRWTYYLIDGGHSGWLMDGQPGGSSSGSKTDLDNLLQLGMPKKIFWAMGMNDPDTASAVNADWNTAYLAVKNFCDHNGIELILATIPTVSGGTVEDSDVPAALRRQQYKNAIVRNSGYRYVDFDKAVGANETTGQWYSGMLSSDGVHPTATGAVALYMQAITDFPELMTT